MSKKKIPELKVPAAYYDEALAFCNARRKENGKRPIKKLPPGVPGDVRSCPCAKACVGISVGELTWWNRISADADGSDLDEISPDAFDGAPGDFVFYFDMHGAPLGLLVLPVRGDK